MDSDVAGRPPDRSIASIQSKHSKSGCTCLALPRRRFRENEAANGFSVREFPQMVAAVPAESHVER